MRRSWIPFRRTICAALLVSLAIAAAVVAHADEPSEIRVANPKVIVPESWENATAYLVLQNKGKTARKIVGGRCSGCDGIEIRRAVFRDGRMESEKLEEMEIPAGGAVAFVPRGLSLSLVGLNEVEEGATVAFELEFADGEKLPVEAVAVLE
jgi:copper(I)-binding protein